MSENLYYLFVSGLLLGSGPCLASCAPFLIVYTAAHKAGWRDSLASYIYFSFGRLVSYVLLGFACMLFAASLHGEILSRYSQSLYLVLGVFVILLGIATYLGREGPFARTCQILHQGHIRNVGVAGFLIGLSPCLPLLGILNYVVLISKSFWDAPLYLFVFGLGTVFSPLAFGVMFSGKLSQLLSGSQKAKRIVQYACGFVLIALGARIVLGFLR